ncbi:5835d3f1-c08a-49c0-ab6d-f4daa8b81667 [Thermothielavioides terrestris]|uniref:5835d3f1-c08a-49c0-ab6d-f4daa8b81667 n=1 Tax=Thermothielavioides terrestris TaxID=2587410 RepID=A0A3S4EYM1_9PEZI|nr:5835d3f1-c08a-49c0-ab6d-f4daa8b81667 [Thermothielavioides terrestris]
MKISAADRASSTSRDESTREPQSSRLPGLLEDGSAVIEDKARRPRYKSSTLFGSRSRRTDLKLRKSLRSSSTTEDLAASSSGPLNYPAEQKTLSLKTRKASMSLRLKIKNFFSGTKPDEGAASIPCQHIESQRSRVTVIPTPSDDAEAPADQDREVIRGPPARVPSLQIVSPGLVHSSRASVVSLKSERDRNVSDGSSLTSWVHSGPSTLTSQEQQQWREWERQRLSIIRENGARTPSTSLPRQPHGSGLFQPPESAAGRPVASRPVVDSQRIYSALVKRMHALGLKMKEKTAEERSEAVESDRSAPPKEHPDRSASNTPDTIRPGDEEQAVSGHNGIFAQDDAQSDWRSRVVDSPASYLFRTASSYRRALRKSMQEEQNAWAQQSSASEQDSDTGTQVRHSSQFTGLLASESNSAKDLDYAESIYSSDDGVFGSALPSAATKKQSVMVETPAMYRAGGCREASAASSIEWKTWLSANIGKFEPSPTPSKPAEAVFGQPTMPRSVLSGHFASTRRHVREQAQIHDEDDHMDDDKGGDVFSSAERKPALPAISTPTPLSRRRRTTTTTAAAVAATRTATPLSQLEPNVLKPPRLPLPTRRRPRP